MIPAGGYVTFDESDFNADPLAPESFALSGSEGDSVWLVKASGNEIEALVDVVQFAATLNGISLGRVADEGGRLVPLAQPSLGQINGMFRISDLVISEVNYHPADPIAAALALDPSLNDDDLEFVEIYNRSEAAVLLTDWRLRGDVDYDFDDGQLIADRGSLVIVSFDPALAESSSRVAAFRTHYGIDDSVTLLGPFSGSLNNSYGLVKLLAVDAPPPENLTLVPNVLVDEVLYDDLAPWPTDADGTGPSLNRISPSTLGPYWGSWQSYAPSPGGVPSGASVLSIAINGGDGSRSGVTSIEVEFAGPVNVGPDSFRLQNVSTNQPVSGLAVASSLVDGKTLATITFTSGVGIVPSDNASVATSLEDGAYQLTVLADRVRLQSNGFGMDSDVADTFFRKFGDQDGDGRVSLLDFAEFRRSFGKAIGDAAFHDGLDSDRDGVITLLDFAAFRRNFG